MSLILVLAAGNPLSAKAAAANPYNRPYYCSSFAYFKGLHSEGIVCNTYTPDPRLAAPFLEQHQGVVPQNGNDQFCFFRCLSFGEAGANGLWGVTCDTYQFLSVSACFPNTMIVLHENKGLIPMDQINLGDSIQVSFDEEGKPLFGEILDIPHRATEESTFYEQIVFEYSVPSGRNGEVTEHLLEMSQDHLIYVAQTPTETFDSKNAQTRFAGDLKSGDLIWVNQKTAKITAKLPAMRRQGLFAPHTSSGTLVIYGNQVKNSPGVITSCYSGVSYPAFAQAYFSLRRTLWAPKSLAEEPVRGAGAWEQKILNLLP